MSIESEFELWNTREKLALLEARCRESEAKPSRTHIDMLSLESLKKLVKQLREEITLAEIQGFEKRSQS
jgi:hypothetical protein